MQTTVKANAGGTVAFDETLSFSKRKDRHIIKARLTHHTESQQLCACLRLLAPPCEGITIVTPG